MNALVALSVSTTGCGQGNRLETAPVHGTVTLDGEPLKMGSVIFTPENGRSAKSQIREDGTYQLGTYEEADGAILGKHKVVIQARPKLQGESKGAPLIPRYGPSVIPETYADQETSPLEFEVVEGPNEINIELSSSVRLNTTP